MQLISAGNFYLGIDDDKYCEFDVHLGRLNIQYSCPNLSSHEDEDGRQDGKAIRSLPESP